MAARYKQELFTSVDTRKYREVLPINIEQALKRVLMQMKVDAFLTELHECIVLQLTISTDPHDEDHIDNSKHQLAHVLEAYIDGKDYGTPVPALTNGTFPPEILVDQCVDTWRVAYAFLCQQA